METSLASHIFASPSNENRQIFTLDLLDILDFIAPLDFTTPFFRFHMHYAR